VQLGKLQGEKDEVMKQLKGEWNKLQSLWNELGTPRNPQDYSTDINTFDPNGEFTSIDESKLGSNTVRRYRLQVQHWTAERDARARTVADISALIAQLETQLGEQMEIATRNSWAPCGFERIQSLQQHFEMLSKTRDERQKQMSLLRKDIGELYELLGTAPAERISLQDESNLSRRMLDDSERELSRLTLLKAAKMKDLVEGAANELRKLYAELGLGEGKLVELLALGVSEDVLHQVQAEVDTMKQVISSCRQITELIPIRTELRQLHAEVEARQQDPSRLLSKKGGRSLIQEQKMEARVKRDLPPLERKMLHLIAKWEAKYGREFVYNGERYADVIVQDQVNDARAIEERKQRIADRKMRSMDQSSFFDRSTVVAPATASRAHKTQSRIAPAQRDVQSARTVKTQSRLQMNTPTNVAARTPSVSVSRNHRSTTSRQGDTTPVTRGGGKYAKVKSKIDTGRGGGGGDKNLKSVTNHMKL
jgi:hypothetical protein